MTGDELDVLRLIQDSWGSQNTEADVFFMNGKSTGAVSVAGAWIIIKGPDGAGPGAVNLTNTAAWYKDGTYSYDDLLRAVRGPDWFEREP